MAITEKPVQEIANELAWRRGVLVFDNATLGDVVAEINRYNRQKLVISDADAAQLKIVGTFRTDDAYHRPPRGVVIPRAFKASAI